MTSQIYAAASLIEAISKIKQESSDSDNQKIDSERLYPFIFARATEESQKLYENGHGDLVVRDWIVIIALPDFKVYNSRWMQDPEQGNFCFIPEVDISFSKVEFKSFTEARKYVSEWWKNQS